MNKIKQVCLASLLAAGAAQASTPCNGFEIKIKNNLAENLLVRKIQLQGADLSPGGIEKLDAGSEKVFTVNKSTEDGAMIGELIFDTISLPFKEVKIQFDLTNKGPICEHNDRPQETPLSVEKTRIPGKGVNYTINNG